MLMIHWLNQAITGNTWPILSTHDDYNTIIDTHEELGFNQFSGQII